MSESTDLMSRIRDRSSRNCRVAVFGQGYVGLVLAMGAWEAGFEVFGIDIDSGRIERLQAKQSYIEDVTDAALARAVGNGYRPTTDHKEALQSDIVVITVPTPLYEHRPHLEFVELAAESAAEVLAPGGLVVLESTTYPGTTDEIVEPIVRSSPGASHGGEFLLGYSPERIDPGNKTNVLENTPKIVSGIDERSLDAVVAFYSCIVDTLVPVAGCREAELAKLVENTFRHVNIALMNELAMFAHDMDVDIWSALDAAATKPFGYMPFRPGPGVGGHCLPVDPSYLSWRARMDAGRPFHFIELANEINESMPDYIVRRIQANLNQQGKAVNGSKIVVLGYAYKKNTTDCRETPSRPIVGSLLQHGAALQVFDSHVDMTDGPTEIMPILRQHDVEDADLVVILTDHDEFDYSMVARHARAVLDIRGRLRPNRDKHIEYL